MPEGAETKEQGDQAAQAPSAGPAAFPEGKVFISYTSADKAAADSIVAALECGGIPCWIAPRDVTPGVFYADAIVQALNAAQLLIVVVSVHSVGSQHVLREVERASSKKRPLVAFCLDATPLPPGLEYFLSASHWLDASAGAMSAALPQLVEAARKILALPAPTAAQAPPRETPPFTSIWQRLKENKAAQWTLAYAAFAFAFLGSLLWIFPPRSAEHVAPVTLSVPTSGNVPSLVSDKSIAVMPFVDMSENRDQEYFADGVAEEILNLLAKVPDLKVIGRTSSFSYRGKADDLRAIGAALGATYVVEGSVRRTGDHVRITAQLISTRDGVHRWSETYDRDVKDVLKIQAEMAASLVRGLQLEVAPSLLSQWAASTQNSEAHDLYLRAQHALYRFDQRGLEEAEVELRRALEVDPSFVPAAETLAATLFDLTEMGFVAPEAGYERARGAALSALKLQPDSGFAHAVLGGVYFQHDWDWSAAGREFETAAALAPKNPFVLIEAALERTTVGDWNEALRYLNAANAADPLDAATYTTLANVYMHLGRPAEAENAARRALDISPTYAGAHGVLGEVLLLEGKADAALAEMKIDNPKESPTPRMVAVYWAMHRTKESDALLARLAALPETETSPTWVAGAYAYRGEKDRALDLLEKAYARRESGLCWIKTDLLLRSLDHHPRYDALLRKMNLPE